MRNATIKQLVNLPKDIKHLVRVSEFEGHRFVRRLQVEWHSAENRFDKCGESLFGAFEQEKLVAICGVNRDPYCVSSAAGRLRHLYVHPNYRRMGIGRDLVLQCLDCASIHFDVIRLRTTDARAESLYKGLGFCAVSELTATHELLIT